MRLTLKQRAILHVLQEYQKDSKGLVVGGDMIIEELWFNDFVRLLWGPSIYPHLRTLVDMGLVYRQTSTDDTGRVRVYWYAKG